MLYNIIKNMEYTCNIIYNSEILEYIKNTDLLLDIERDDYEDNRDKYPILKVLKHLKEKDKQFTLLNILSSTYDLFYSPVRDIKKKRLKYTYEIPIIINSEDVLNYLGDSYYQNCLYEKGFRNTVVSDTKTINNILVPGCKYDLYDKNIKNNKYVTSIPISKEITKKNDIHIDTIIVVGNDLHQKYGITSNGARRNAFVYNIDIRNVEPGFGVSDILTKGMLMRNNFAIHKEDIEKYMEKGGNSYTILEKSENEIAEMKKIKIFNEKYTWLRNKQFDMYFEAVRQYYESPNKLRTLDIILTKGINHNKVNKECLMKYIEKIDDAIEKGQISKKKDMIKLYMGSLIVYPDFKYGSWGSRKKLVHDDFEKKFGITINHYIGNNKRDIIINISRPREFFKISQTYKLPF
jgi:hypothetical protein